MGEIFTFVSLWRMKKLATTKTIRKIYGERCSQVPHINSCPFPEWERKMAFGQGLSFSLLSPGRVSVALEECCHFLALSFPHLSSTYHFLQQIVLLPGSSTLVLFRKRPTVRMPSSKWKIIDAFGWETLSAASAAHFKCYTLCQQLHAVCVSSNV